MTAPRHAAPSPRHVSRPDPVDARRAARFRAARNRIAKIVEGSPPLTEEQLHVLAVMLTGGQDGDAHAWRATPAKANSPYIS